MLVKELLYLINIELNKAKIINKNKPNLPYIIRAYSNIIKKINKMGIIYKIQTNE